MTAQILKHRMVTVFYSVGYDFDCGIILLLHTATLIEPSSKKIRW